MERLSSRWMYWSPWGTTDPWKPRIFRGGDEHHNQSIAIVLPLLGTFIFFYEKSFSRRGAIHAWAWTGSQIVGGTYYPRCRVCQDLKKEMENV